MAGAFVTMPVRFRPDQIDKFQELYPNQQFAPFLRNVLDFYLGEKPSNGNREAETRRLYENHRRKAELYKADLENIENEKRKRVMDDALEKDRVQYLTDNPKVLQTFQAGNVSSKGYQLLQKDLKFSSKTKLVEWLNEQVNSLKISAIRES